MVFIIEMLHGLAHFYQVSLSSKLPSLQGSFGLLKFSPISHRAFIYGQYLPIWELLFYIDSLIKISLNFNFGTWRLIHCLFCSYISIINCGHGVKNGLAHGNILSRIQLMYVSADDSFGPLVFIN
jgi:hypothetical protein